MHLDFLSGLSFIATLSIPLIYITGNLFKMPTAVGFLITGIIASMPIFGFAKVVEKGNLLGDFGLLFLMFYIGMEFSYSRLHKLKRYIRDSLIIYIFSIVAVILAFSILEMYLGFDLFLNLHTKLFFVFCFAMSSTAITMQIIDQSKVKDEEVIQLVVTSLVVQDVFAILLMLLASTNMLEMYSFSGVFHNMFKPIFLTSLYIIVAANLIFKPTLRFFGIKQSTSILPLFSLSLVLISSYMAAINGISQEFGVFLSGMILGDTEYKYMIISDIKPFQDLFLGLFFLSIGSSLNFAFLKNNILSICIGLLLLFVLKFIAIALPTYFFNRKVDQAFAVSGKLCNISEIVFVILSMVYKMNGLSSYSYDLLKMITFSSFIISPLLNKVITYFVNRWRKVLKKGRHNNGYTVVIVGYNNNLLTIVSMLEDRSINCIIIEQNLKRFSAAVDEKLNVIYGNGLNRKILEEININHTDVMFLNFEIHKSTAIKIEQLKHAFPSLSIIALSCAKEVDQKVSIPIIMNNSVDETINVARIIFQNVNQWNYEENEEYLRNLRNKLIEYPPLN